MTLTAWDMAAIDRLAAELADRHKRHASRAYRRWAANQGWWMQPEWIPARNAFWAAHKRHRAAYMAVCGAGGMRVAEDA